MAASPNSSRKTLYLLLLLPLLGAVAFSQGLVNQQRGQLSATYMEPIQNAPPLMRFTSETLGGFRGVLSTILWMRISQMQQDGKYFEMMQLSDWITKLQPHTPRVWTDRAWNLAYNISVKEKDTDKRWKWVESGISLLRDQAIQYNPHEPELYHELAWIFQHKMGQDMDVAQRKYKNIWINQMTDVLWPSLEDCLENGGRPNFEELINPPQDDSEQSEAVRERVKRLTQEFKMDPRKMQQMDRELGMAMVPNKDGNLIKKDVGLEWRLPETHAIYWSWVGYQKCQHNNPRKDLIRKLRRLMFQSLFINYKRGRLVVDRNFQDWKQRYKDGRNWVLYSRMESVEIVDSIFQKQIDWIETVLAGQQRQNREIARRVETLGFDADDLFERPEEVTDATLETFRNAHHNFCRKAVTDLYMYNRIDEALYYFNLLCEKYPEKMKWYIGYDVETETMRLDVFATERVVQEMKNGGRTATLANLEQMIWRAYVFFSMEEDEQAKGLMRLAKRAYDRYNRRKVGTEEDRVLIPPFEHIHDTTLNKWLAGAPPLRAANLRRRLGLKEGEKVEYDGLPELINPFDKEKKKAIPGAGN